jgi:hypothetical protein
MAAAARNSDVSTARPPANSQELVKARLWQISVRMVAGDMQPVASLRRHLRLHGGAPARKLRRDEVAAGRAPP